MPTVVSPNVSDDTGAPGGGVTSDPTPIVLDSVTAGTTAAAPVGSGTSDAAAGSLADGPREGGKSGTLSATQAAFSGGTTAAGLSATHFQSGGAFLDPFQNAASIIPFHSPEALADAALATLMERRPPLLLALSKLDKASSSSLGVVGASAPASGAPRAKPDVAPSLLLLFNEGKPLGLNNTVPEGEEGPAVVHKLFTAMGVADPQSGSSSLAASGEIPAALGPADLPPENATVNKVDAKERRVRLEAVLPLLGLSTLGLLRVLTRTVRKPGKNPALLLSPRRPASAGPEEERHV